MSRITALDHFFVLGAALAGKETAEFILKKIKQPASKFRYYFGVGLFIASFFLSWIVAYSDYIEAIQMPLNIRFYVTLSLDIVFFISMFIMGPAFFTKLASIFTYEEQLTEAPVSPK